MTEANLGLKHLKTSGLLSLIDRIQLEEGGAPLWSRKHQRYPYISLSSHRWHFHTRVQSDDIFILGYPLSLR
jgi:hypothetical protein